MYYSVIGLISILIHLILNQEFFRNKEDKNDVNTAFKRYLWAVLMYYTADALWGVIYDTHIGWLIYVDTVLYYIAMAFTVVLLCRYVTTYLNLHKGFGKFINNFGIVFGFTEILVLIVNHFVPIFFWIDSNAEYHASSIRYVALYMLVLLCAMLAIQTGYVARITVGNMKRRFFAIFIFCITMIIAIIAQIVYILLPMYSIGLVIGIAAIHTFVKLDEKEEQQMLLEKKNEEQYAQLEEIVELNEQLKEQQASRDELHAVLETMAEIFYSLHEIDLINDTVSVIKATGQVKKIVSHREGASEMMVQVMNSVTVDEYRETALEFVNLGTVADRMQNKKVISGEFVGVNVGWFAALFIVMEKDENNKPTKVIFTTRVIEEEKREKEKLIRKSQTDELTGLLNRRAYEEDIYEHNDTPVEDEYIYISLDVNGLKVVNDNIGHVAGDELIIGACTCMKRILGPHGRLYRIGGDEFVAILYVEKEKLAKLLSDFDEAIAKWTGKLIDSLSISYGYVTKEEYPNDSVRELAAKAEQRMYESKSAYYKKKGIDRRGQQDAHRALCDLYTKILKINITDDTFQIVNMNEEERKASLGYSDKISKWLYDFGASGQIHEDDLPEYNEKTAISYMSEYFKNNKTSHSVFYRRKMVDEYKQVMMEIIPANDYSDDNQSLFLYVKQIDK